MALHQLLENSREVALSENSVVYQLLVSQGNKDFAGERSLEKLTLCGRPMGCNLPPPPLVGFPLAGVEQIFLFTLFSFTLSVTWLIPFFINIDFYHSYTEAHD